MYMKVLLVCCKGFEMMEFSSFYDVLTLIIFTCSLAL